MTSPEIFFPQTSERHKRHFPAVLLYKITSGPLSLHPVRSCNLMLWLPRLSVLMAAARLSALEWSSSVLAGALPSGPEGDRGFVLLCICLVTHCAPQWEE